MSGDLGLIASTAIGKLRGLQMTPERQWLHQRGIDDQSIEDFQIQTNKGWVGFPFVGRDGEKKFTKWRKLDKSAMRIEWHTEEKSLIAYHEAELDACTNGVLVITEGEIDCITISQHSFLPVISVPNGAPSRLGEGDVDPLDDQRFSWMWGDDGKLREEIAQFESYVLLTDGDGPGKILAAELAIRLGREKCYLPDYPAGTKDANEVKLEYGAEKLVEVIRTAKPLVPPKLARFCDIAQVEYEPGLSSGMQALDDHLLLTFPELVTVTGVPGAGKSQWVVWYTCQLARLHGVRTALLQLEDNPERNRADLMNYARAWKLNQSEFLDRHFMTLVPDHERAEDEDMTLGWLEDTIREAACHHGCKVVVIDPWNEIEHHFGRNMTETQYTSDALRRLKRLARQYQITVIVVAHPTKGVAEKGIGDLTMYDVAGSSNWANKSDHGIIVYREEYSDETQVKIAKCKDHTRMGQPGIVTMRFNRQTSSFEFIRRGI